MGQHRQSVEKLFGDALDMAPEARRAFLEAACQDEPELKHLIEQLLMEDERAGSFLKKPPFDFSTKVGIHTHTMPLIPGSRLGPYEILVAVGAGGMGEVYRARDTRLGRDVAVKILSTHLSSDPDLKWRFEREARAISSLNHPHICALYDIGQEDSVEFLVMEYLEGETLEARLCKGALPIEEVFRIAIQIAGALDAAHRRGIVHRDLKPGNVMLTRGGAKLLDFGLAKIAGPVVSYEADTLGTTAASPITAQGTILGTLQYMSPEQLEGKESDARSDIFSFGAMLYEMITGRKCFEGSSHASLIAAVMSTNPPPVSAIQPLASPALDRLVRRCLAKSPDDRWQSAADLLSELERITETGSRAGIPAPVAALIIVCVVSAIGIAALIRSASLRSALQPKPSSGEPNMMSSDLSSSVLTSAPGHANSPSFSPDGRQIAFVWNGVERTHYDIYVQLVGGDTPLQLTHHKRGDGVPGPPQWSPDGREIAFARCNSERDGVYTVPALGGPERRLTNSPCREGVAGRPTWTPDSKAMVMLDQCTPGGPRAVVLFSFATGEKRCLATGSHGDFAADDALSPDGRTVAFFRYTDAGYSELYAVPLTGGPPKLVSHGTNFWNPMWTPDGKYIVLYWLRGNMLRPWRVPVAGGPFEPEMVYPGVGSISQDGRKLVYEENQAGGASSHFAPAAIWRADLSKAGGPVLRTKKLIYSQFMEDAAQPSPDGTRLALQSARSGTHQIWLNSSEGDHPVQLTTIGRFSGTPRWSPDGRWIAFDARVEDNVHIYSHVYVVDAEGRNLHAITHGDSDNYVPSWSRDGRSIYFTSPRAGGRQIWKHSLEDGSERRLTEHGGFDPLESYDGRTIYYSKFDEPGIWSMPASGGSESPVVTGKPQVGYWGNWSLTESGLYLLDADAEPRPTIEFYSFATRRITPVLSLENSPSEGQPSLSASRDGRTIFYTQCDPQSVIKMVENFRQE